MAVILKLDRIAKRYGAVVIADGLDLSLAAGEALGLIGPNGAGKTTLFGIAAGTVVPDAGRVFLDGQDITRLPIEQRTRLGLARTFQIPQPFRGMNVFENLLVAAAFGAGLDETAARSQCAEILERCKLTRKANVRAGSLTLLDRKRLELARALAANPRVLLFDEIAGGLTEHECADLVALIKEVRANGVSIIWTEHIVHALLAVADRLAVLSGGKLIANGEPRAVIAHPKVREIYMGIPQ